MLHNPFKNCVKQLYISNKMELFSYIKDECGVHGCRMHIKVFKRHIKRRLALTTDKWLNVISNITILKTVIPLRN